MDSKSTSELAAASPSSVSVHRGKLVLPASCEPPLPNSPRKQLVWIVCDVSLSLSLSLSPSLQKLI